MLKPSMLKKSWQYMFVIVMMTSLWFAVSPSRAQSVLDLPRPSQRAEVMQRIGITEIKIDYARPLVKGRKIWGTIVPYGQVWRAGADENTTIEFTDPVSVEGQPVPKGVYGLHMIPGESEWTVILSKNSTSWGSFTYDKAEDALRVPVKPQPAEFHEALTYDFDDAKPESAVVTLRWEKVAVPFKVGVNVNEVVAQSLRKQVRGWAKYTWEGWDEAANYLLANKGNLQDALEYSKQSIAFEERFDNVASQAMILDALGRKEEAAAAHNKAIEMGTAIQLHSFGRQLQTQGKQQEALEIFRINIKKHPNDWIIHNEQSRLAVAQGDWDSAVKEMKLALAGAPDLFKPAIEGLVRRVQAKEDINK